MSMKMKNKKGFQATKKNTITKANQVYRQKSVLAKFLKILKK